jgi:adhesin HecA-like repeat protein
MAAVEADRVVVALEAQLANYESKVTGAAKTFDASMSQIERSAARAETVTRSGFSRIGESSRSAGASQMILQSIVRRTSDQFAAGAPLTTIFAEHIAGLAEAGALAGGSLGKLGAFLAGPWGLILSAAVTAASVLGAKLLEGGEAAKKQKDQLQRLTEALQEYQRTSGEAVSNDYVRIRLMEVLTARTAAHTVQIRENIKAQLAQAEASAAVANANPGATTAGSGANQVANLNVASLQARLTKAEADVQEARRNANVASGNRLVADQDRNAAGADSIAAAAAKVKDAQDRYAVTLNNLSVGLRKGDITQGDFNRLTLAARRRMEAVVNAPALQRKDDAAQRKADADARKAEQERLKGVRDEAAYQTALNKGTLELLGVRADLTADSRLADELQRQQIEQERKDKNRDVDSNGPAGTKRFSAAEVEKLKALNDEVAAAKTDLVNRHESVRFAQEELSLRSADLDNQRSIVEAQGALADTTEARRVAALKLLDLDDQLQRAQLEAVIASKEATEVQKKIAQGRLNTLDQTRPERQAAVQRANQGPLASFLDTIPDTAGKLNDAFENVATNGLKSLTDGITDAITGAKSLGDVFKHVANQIISDLIRIAVERAIIEPLANALFPGGGAIASSIFGRASGGPVTAGRMYRVNESGSPGRVEGFVPQGSGKIIPLGRMDAAMAGGGTTVIHQSFNLDARYGITTPELIRYVNQTAQSAAASAGAASYKAAQASAPARIQKQQTLGT